MCTICTNLSSIDHQILRAAWLAQEILFVGQKMDIPPCDPPALVVLGFQGFQGFQARAQVSFGSFDGGRVNKLTEYYYITCRHLKGSVTETFRVPLGDVATVFVFFIRSEPVEHPLLLCQLKIYSCFWGKKALSAAAQVFPLSPTCCPSVSPYGRQLCAVGGAVSAVPLKTPEKVF